MFGEIEHRGSCPTKTATGSGTGTGSGSGSGTDGEFDDGSDGSDGGSGDYDLCTGLTAKKGDIDGFSEYIDELCGTGDGANKLPTLRKTENVFKGGEPKLLKKENGGGGKTVSIRLFTSTVVEAKASDYFALVRLQVSKPDKFGENYEHDDGTKMSNVEASSSSSKFTYDYSTAKAGLRTMRRPASTR